MNVSLPPEYERYVRQKVESEGYASASEVFRESLRLLRERDMQLLEALRADVQAGIKSLRGGRGRVLDEATLERVVAKGRKLLRR
jgi:putative addiction module CopG family antidote